ncbi:alpha-amylase family glycosyl hydrolase [uncultured Mameliella sp.]|uniref:beta-galactosidase BglA n=1 Tax=uncultured Mameliella sp. TaxID=1447087 RepID=UPI002621C7B1|nr:alpha-amylase family glycosyl hydrolase [uncultured Mameliella sp.]
MNAQLQTQTDPSADKDWWRGAVIYQIYPRSYQDSNGDGVGDLNGITARLPYVASLGVDAIWISPFFTSPMKDFGYDVSDYCDVDPMFGSLSDFDVMVDTAHKLGIRVMIDLVLSHTSDQHPWFAQSRANRDNPKADWYVWADPKPDGTPPNNWLSIFGGSAWHWDARREQYYLHNFLTEQPDLNFHNPDVQEALLNVVRFWLDRGVDGFRLDTINFYVHDQQLRDNPPLPVDQRDASIAPRVNPYNHQLHLYDKNRPENLDFLARFRAVLDEYDATTAVGEVGDAQKGLEIMGEYTAGDERVHMCYSFEFLSGTQPDAARIADVMERVDTVVPDGWACWAFSNHDVVRHASRWELSPSAQKAFATLMMCLRGSVCIYQGEELGLPEADVPFEDLQDPYGIEFWPEFKGRDGCRTPMVWEKSNQNGGFTTGDPWLPVSHAHLGHAVSEQEHDPGALLHHYRKAIHFRATHPALVKGTHDKVKATGSIVHFIRNHEGEEVFVAVNMSGEPAVIEMPAGNWQQIGQELGSATAAPDGKLHLGPWQPALARRQA